MNLNTVFYQLFAPSPILAIGGDESWKPIAVAGTYHELSAVADKLQLVRYVIAVSVIISTVQPLDNSPLIGDKSN